MSNTDKKHTLAYLGLAMTALFWAGNAVVARGTSGDIPPLALAFWRWAIALVVIAPFGFPRVWREWSTIRRHFPQIVSLAVFSVGLFNTLLYLAAQSTGAVNIALMNSTIPIAVALLVWLVLREPVSPRQAGGIGLALIGMLVIIAKGSLNTLVSFSFNAGDLIMVGAVMSWGLYSVLLRRHNVPLHPITLLTVLIALGLPIILPFYLTELYLSGGFALSARLIPPFLYVGVFPSVLAYLFWNHGVAVIGPARSAMFIYLTPVFATGLALIFLDERLHLFHAAGAVLILAGLFLATRPSLRRAPVPPLTD